MPLAITISAAPVSANTAIHSVAAPSSVATFRAENAYLPTDLRIGTDPAGLGDLAGLVAAYAQAGLDTVITDHPDRVA